MSELEIDFRFGATEQGFIIPDLTLVYDTEELPQKLLDKGFTDLLVRIADFAEYVAVDDDAEFLADAYIALTRLVRQRQDHARHSVFLGDGRLDIEAIITGTRVLCTIDNYPHMRKDLGSSKSLELPLQDYAHGWWRAIQQLIEPLGDAGG